ncbi:MAG: EamA family transporter, partial [Candidatus Aenigmarchaeota archaeon]|nr:EamA family transporter [Candidatus Aenigmarchaeota archaeon]
NLKDIYIIGFFGTTITFILLFFGARMTSGINTAILLQTEPIYSIFLSYFLLKERITKKQIFSTILILIGVVTVVYSGTFSLNLGDLFIILTPLFWQISHLLSKKSIKRLGTFFIQGGRYLSAGLTMLLISTLIGSNQFGVLYKPAELSSILIIGFVVAGIGSLAWYESIKRINLSKATAMISPYSVLSVILAWFILSELPSIYQIIGLIFVLVGMLLLSRVKSRKRE